MRLYLSSFRLGKKPEELSNLVKGTKAVVIANAIDNKSAVERSASVQTEIDNLKELNIVAEELDLRQYFGKSSELGSKFNGVDLVWVRGGNPFVLRRAFRMSGFDGVLSEHLTKDSFVYGGYSAAINMLQPHLHGVELVDDPHSVPPGYDKDVIWEGLGILPYCVAPHYSSDHPESADIDKTIQYYVINHIPFIALTDGEAIVVNGDVRTIISAPFN